MLEAAIAELRRYHHIVAILKQAELVYSRVDKAVAENDGKLAIRLLWMRAGVEDEGYTIYEVAEEYMP